ncbi:MAG TPA: (d)CMP kinase [Bacillota bacterium]|nr:(d)CMP kinase [Bacillota bacterium]
MHKTSRALNVAIDGPAGAGKSTVAKLVARELGLRYLDTGAMYRALTYLVIEQGIDPHDEETIAALSLTMVFGLDSASQLTLSGAVLGEEIRTPEVSALVSLVSSHAAVREAIVLMQQMMAREGGIVMDGRDIGTTVMTDAEIKIFLTADIRERARRRWREMQEKGYTVDLEEIVALIEKRDLFDSSRETSPLRPAEDALILDTTTLSLEEVVHHILKIVAKRRS